MPPDVVPNKLMDMKQKDKAFCFMSVKTLMHSVFNYV